MALIILSLSMLLSALGTSVANIALPTLSAGFSAPFAHVQWVVLAYLASITILLPIAGRVGDIVGRGRLLLGGFAVFTAGSVGCATATTLTLLIVARGVQGAGAAAMMALGVALVGELVPKERAGRAMGLLGTMSAIGTALGPSLGGAVISTLGWRWAFAALAVMGLAGVILGLRSLRLERPAPRTLATVTAPMAILTVIRDRTQAGGIAMSYLVSTVMMATLVVGPFYLSGDLGLEAALVGLAVSVGPIIVALTGVPTGRMVDRFGARRVAVAGLGGITLGCMLLSASPVSLGIPGYLVPIVFITAGYAAFQTANSTAVMAGVGVKRRGFISGLLGLSRNLGLVTGTSAMGSLFLATGMAGTFAVAALLALLASWVAVRQRRVA